MSELAATNLIYLVGALPLVVGAVWSMYRHSALPLLEELDADEMLVAAVHRLATGGYLLVASAFAVVLTPGPGDVGSPMNAVFNAWATLLFVLATLHLGVLGTFALMRYHRLQRDLPRQAPGPWAASGPAPVPRPLPAQQPVPVMPPFLNPPMPPAPAMPPTPTQAQPAFAARPVPFGAQPFGAQPFGVQPFGAQPFGAQPFGAQPYGQLPRNPWAPPFR